MVMTYALPIRSLFSIHFLLFGFLLNVYSTVLKHTRLSYTRPYTVSAKRDRTNVKKVFSVKKNQKRIGYCFLTRERCQINYYYLFGRHRVSNVRKIKSDFPNYAKGPLLHLYICEIVPARQRSCGKVMF